MNIIYLGSTKAFIEIEEGEEYPETIRVKVDRNRTFEKHICKQCSKIFYSRKKGRKDYCSNECYSNNKRNIIICSSCGKEFSKRKSTFKNSKHKKYFCSRTCKDFGQSLEGGIKEIQPSHYGDGVYYYSERAFRKQKQIYGYNFCEKCDERDKLYLIVHHRDCNRQNSNINNLQVLCANCHIKWHRLNNNGDFV